MALGGRVAEELIMDDISTGASNDLERVTNTARAMVTKYGMSEKMGPMVYGDSDDEVFLGNSITTKKNYSEEIAYEIDKEVRSIVENAYEECKRILKENMAKLHYVAKGLLLYETLDAEQFIQAFNETLSLDEKDVFAKKDQVKVDLDKDKHNSQKQKDESLKLKEDEFKLPEDENK